MWTCPVCNRNFRNKNQWHSCANKPVEDHFKTSPPALFELYKDIVDYIDSLGPYEESSIKTCINFRAGATFLSCKVKRDYLELEFQLPYLYDGFPMKKVVRVSANRFFYVLAIDPFHGIDQQLKGWLRDAYVMVRNQK